jgi:hypothetical protein
MAPTITCTGLALLAILLGACGQGSGNAGGAPDASHATPDGGVADAAPSTGDAAVSGDAAIDAPPDAPPPDDPFDDASCPGPTLTNAELVALFTPGETYHTLGAYTLSSRTRACNEVTGCGDWGPEAQAHADPPAGNVTGGFALGGTVRLYAYAYSGRAYVRVQLVDASETSAGNGTTDFDAEVDTAPDATATFEHADGYDYEAENVLYIPPIPTTRELPADFAVTITSSCVRVVGLPTATQQTKSYALLTRF